MRRADGQSATYDPKRLQGINAFRESSREFAQGDRVRFTGIIRELGIANRDLGTIIEIEGTQISVKMDGEKPREITFDSAQMRHIDHGYAVTSHSSQGLTTGRVLVNMDTTTHAELINSLCLRLGLAGLAGRQNLHQRRLTAGGALSNERQQVVSRYR